MCDITSRVSAGLEPAIRVDVEVRLVQRQQQRRHRDSKVVHHHTDSFAFPAFQRRIAAVLH